MRSLSKRQVVKFSSSSIQLFITFMFTHRITLSSYSSLYQLVVNVSLHQGSTPPSLEFRHRFSISSSIDEKDPHSLWTFHFASSHPPFAFLCSTAVNPAQSQTCTSRQVSLKFSVAINTITSSHFLNWQAHSVNRKQRLEFMMNSLSQRNSCEEILSSLFEGPRRREKRKIRESERDGMLRRN